MRLFFGLAVSDEVGAAAAALIERLRACGAEYRWVKPKGLHLTLNFLGETPLERLPALEEVLRRAARRLSTSPSAGREPSTRWRTPGSSGWG